MNWPSRTYAAPHFLYINDSRGGPSHKPGGFLRSPRYYLKLKFYCFLLLRQINDDDDDDDDDDDYSFSGQWTIRIMFITI